MRIAALGAAPRQLELIGHAMAVIGHECHGFEDGRCLQRARWRPCYCATSPACSRAGTRSKPDLCANARVLSAALGHRLGFIDQNGVESPCPTGAVSE